MVKAPKDKSFHHYDGDHTWAELVNELGPPIYGIADEEYEDRARWSGSQRSGSQLVAITLRYLAPGTQLELETSTEGLNEPSREQTMLSHLMLYTSELVYPLTIEESETSLELEGEQIPYRILTYRETTWCGFAEIGNRWVFLSASGIPVCDFKIEPIELRN